MERGKYVQRGAPDGVGIQQSVGLVCMEMQGDVYTMHRRNEEGLVGVDAEGETCTVRRCNKGSMFNGVRRTDGGGNTMDGIYEHKKKEPVLEN